MRETPKPTAYICASQDFKSQREGKRHSHQKLHLNKNNCWVETLIANSQPGEFSSPLTNLKELQQPSLKWLL